MKRHRVLHDHPIADVAKFGRQWWAWWRENLPGKADTARDASLADADWSPLFVTGPNGLLLFVLSLAWWRANANDDMDRNDEESWNNAVEDLKFAFDRIAQLGTASPSDNTRYVSWLCMLAHLC